MRLPDANAQIRGVDFTEAERMIAVAAIATYVANYRAMEEREQNEKERTYLTASREAGQALSDRIALMVPVNAMIDFRAGELATLDRALRMLQNAVQSGIRPRLLAGEAGNKENAARRKLIEEIGAMFNKVRALRGLPW